MVKLIKSKLEKIMNFSIYYKKDDKIDFSKERKFHLTFDEAVNKKLNLEEKISTLIGSENRKKRQNVFKELSQIKKAILYPNKLLINPIELKQKKQIKIDKRISKKIKKKNEILLEKRKENKRVRNVNCLFCKKYGHSMNECKEREELGIKTNVCYKCGSSDHSVKQCNQEGDDFKFIVCFICKKTGHFSKNCDQNENGIFYKGGGCFFCGSNMHMKIDCPKRNLRNNNPEVYDFNNENNY